MSKSWFRQYLVNVVSLTVIGTFGVIVIVLAPLLVHAIGWLLLHATDRLKVAGIIFLFVLFSAGILTAEDFKRRDH
jgi:hypothetical protein